MADEIGRRDLLKITAVAAMATRSHAAGQHRFFTPEEYTLVDELTESIIPADDRSGGARAAGVADYIDARLIEAFEESERNDWRRGLADVETISRNMHGASFVGCTAAQRTTVVARMAANERKPTRAEEIFFQKVKALTILGYYTSKIGIHDDMGYLGNTLQQHEYAGELPDKAP